jgi:TolA-binding protein
MKYWLTWLLCLTAFEAQAAIYVCKDASNHKTYQDEPCTTQTIGQLDHVPDAPIEDQKRVEQSIRTANENYIKRMQMQQTERLQMQEEERQNLALEIERRRLQQLEQESQIGQPVVILNRWPNRFNRDNRWRGNGVNPYRSYGRYDGTRNQNIRNQPNRGGFNRGGNFGGGVTIEYNR